MGSQKKYYAFISYRHADNKEPGRQWATWLHQAIETYEVPADLVGKTNGRGETIPGSIYPIFRDEEELPANADLGNSIVGALDDSRLLVVLCSPRAVASTYVADEIDYFKKQGHSDHIIAAMIDGEPNTSWDLGKQAAGLTAQDECFPVPLQFEYDAGGKRTDKRAEPIAADFRINNNGQPEQGWTSSEAYRLHLNKSASLSPKQTDKLLEEYQQQQHLMLLKIIAGVLGVPLGELTQRDKEHQLEQARVKAKVLRRWLVAVAALALVAVGAGGVAYKKQQDAVKQTNEAQIAQSKAVARGAMVAFNRGDYEQSIELALSALPTSLTRPDRGYSADAEAILSSAMFHNRLIYSGMGDDSWSDFDGLNKDPYQSYINDESSRLILYGQASPVVIDLLSNTKIELENMPTGKYWATRISAAGRYIGAEVRDNGSTMTYVWSVEDGRLQLKHEAAFGSFSGDEQFVGFQFKGKNKPGYLVEVERDKKIVSFEGLFGGLDNDRGYLFAEHKDRCTRNGFPAHCVVRTTVYSVSTGDVLFAMSGEIIGRVLDGETVLLKNAVSNTPERNAVTGSVNQPAMKINGVSAWDLNRAQQINFYPGEFQLFDQLSNRLITKQRPTGTNQIWDLENGQIVAGIPGDIVGIAHDADAPGRGYRSTDNTLYDDDNNPTFLTHTGDDPVQEVSRVSLLGGQILSQTGGEFLGILESNRIVTHANTDGSHQVFSEDSADPFVEMTDDHCGNDGDSSSAWPMMPNVSGFAVLFNCENNIYLYYPDSYRPGKPQIIPSRQPARWVEDGNLFWYGKDHAELRGFSFWEGGAIDAELLLRVQTKVSNTFRSLAGGKYLLMLTPDSKVQLWDSSGSILNPAVTLDEFELSTSYLNDIDPAERPAGGRALESKVQLTSDLGFNINRIKQAIEDRMERGGEQDFDASDEVEQGRWLEATQIEPGSALSEYQTDNASYFELNDGKLAVVIDEFNAQLVDVRNGKVVSPLSSSPSDREWFFEFYDERVGVSESPGKNGFIFYNPFGIWLFDLQGNVRQVLCDDPTSCDSAIDFEWLEDGQRIFLNGHNPSVFTFATEHLTDLCQSYVTREECRTGLRGPVAYGQKTIATGSTILDLDTGIILVELRGSLGGMYSHPVRFNEDESAILMVAETGGGTLVFGIWRLPLRGDSLLQKARQYAENLWTPP